MGYNNNTTQASSKTPITCVSGCCTPLKKTDCKDTVEENPTSAFTTCCHHVPKEMRPIVTDASAFITFNRHSKINKHILIIPLNSHTSMC